MVTGLENRAEERAGVAVVVWAGTMEEEVSIQTPSKQRATKPTEVAVERQEEEDEDERRFPGRELFPKAIGLKIA